MTKLDMVLVGIVVLCFIAFLVQLFEPFVKGFVRRWKAKRGGAGPKHRFVLSLSGRAYDRTGDLAEQTGASSRAEVVRHALAVYECVVKAKAEGAKLFVVYEDGRQLEVLLSPFEEVDPC